MLAGEGQLPSGHRWRGAGSWGKGMMTVNLLGDLPPTLHDFAVQGQWTSTLRPSATPASPAHARTTGLVARTPWSCTAAPVPTATRYGRRCPQHSQPSAGCYAPLTLPSPRIVDNSAGHPKIALASNPPVLPRTGGGCPVISYSCPSQRTWYSLDSDVVK